MKKRFLSLMLSAAMIASLTGCKSNEEKDPDPTPTPATTPTVAPVEGEEGDPSPTPEQGQDSASTPTYTYRTSTSVFPTNWSPHDTKTQTDSDLMQYLVTGFYTFDYDETLEGFQMVPAAASGEPVDVTADYVGKYGIKEGDASLAWKIPLRDNLKWDDGTPIVAKDFITSAELLLNPDAGHYRADNLYGNTLVIAGAKEFLYSGKHAYATKMIVDAKDEEYIAYDKFEKDKDGFFTLDGKDIAVKLDDGATWGKSLTELHESEDDLASFQKDGVDLYETVLSPAADKDGYVKVTEEVYQALMHIIANQHGCATVEEYAKQNEGKEKPAGNYAYIEWQEFCWYGTDNPEMDFSEVGMLAPSDTELILILEKPLKGFNLKYALTDSWLVKEDLYKSCEKVSDGIYTNSYGTSAETSASYGPYKLTLFQADKQYILEKNQYFYGAKEGQYQTTAIEVNLVSEATTRLEMFINGQLDSYGLTADDMGEYGTSDDVYFETGSSTFFIALNPSLSALEAEQKKLGENYNKTILTVKEFRQALAYALDRSAFCMAADPTSSGAFGMFSSQIISDPENGITYRSTDKAKQVLVNFWGLADDVGEGKLYPTLDDAVESITGYNLAMAKELFDKAYDIAIEQKLMDEDDTIQILIGTPNATSVAYTKGYEFLVNCYTDAVKGTKLEGKLTFDNNNTLGNGFADALRANQVDMLFFVGWSGSAMDPYNLMGAYTTESYQYNPSWDTSKENLTINLDGTDYTATVLEWTECLDGTEITIKAADGTSKQFKAGSSDEVDELRFDILVALENAVLETYEMIPLSTNGSAVLKGKRINYYTEDYNFAMGHGGVQYYTYSYSDQEWDEYVASQGGKLNYK